MKSMRDVGFAVLIGALIYFALSARSPVVAQVGNQTARSPVRWEYKLLYSASEQQFNVLGGAGWELCDVVERSEARENQPVLFVFKRERR